ncbi:CD1375 family protein [Paenibacillus dakarensis]|uniref:CD1375 family protein n=1 Tax=Paenibacillus dakarensis TaxID=1527293 RepID=UPI0006D5AAF6|nr:CD1375 family protein [Paenibacillus dakarensis]
MLSFIIKLILGGIEMVDLYVALIVNGRRTIDQVPERYREQVRIDLSALGLDENGNLLPTE